MSLSLKRFGLGLLLLVPSACGLILEDYRIDDSRLRGSICQLGELRCVSEWLMTCAPTLDGWVDRDACSSPARCDSARGICTECTAGQFRCNGSSLELCNADQSGWDVVEKCQDGVVCNLNLQACAPCTPGEYQCNEGVLSQCSAPGSWGAPKDCGAPELCSVSADRKSGQCANSSSCMPGKYACQDARLVRCDEQGVSWLPIQTCASAALCADSLASATDAAKLARCAEPACDAEQARCDGNQLKVCSDDRKSWVSSSTCSGDAPCNPKLRACARCTPGEKACSGPELFTCDDKGAFQRSDTCESAELCNALDGKCDDPECDATTRASCSPTEPFLLECGEDRKLHQTICETPALCNPREERCEVPVCAASAVRCDGALLEACNPSRTGWQPVENCQSAKFCSVSPPGCSNEPCVANSFRCNDVFIERCGADGYERIARCAAAALCHADSGTCDPPQCSPATFRCLGKSLQRCGPNLSWVDFTTCSGQCDEIRGKCL